MRWHDERARWDGRVGGDLAATVAAEPDRAHRVREWTVPLRDGTAPVEVRGTVDWVPPPSAGLWWAGALGAAAAAHRPGPGRAGVTLAARRMVGDFAVVVAGIAAALVAGLANADAFTHAVVATPGDPAWTRLAVAAVLGAGLGLGLAGAGALRRRRADLLATSLLATTLIGRNAEHGPRSPY